MATIFLKRPFQTVIAKFSRCYQLYAPKRAFTKISIFWREPLRNAHCMLFSTCNMNTFTRQMKLLRTHQRFRFLTTSRNRCWQCNAVITERDLVCLTCGCVQEPREHLNYFEVFKENPQFDVDLRILTIKFRRLQNLLHPDKFATRPEKEQTYSLEQSSRVNRAYQILCNPLERGLYLLDLYEKPLLEDEVDMSPDFLEDIMEINESIAKSDDADSVIGIRNSNNARLEVLFGELSQSFKEKNIDRARETLAKLKYYVSIDNRLKKLEDDLGVSRDD